MWHTVSFIFLFVLAFNGLTKTLTDVYDLVEMNNRNMSERTETTDSIIKLFAIAITGVLVIYTFNLINF